MKLRECLRELYDEAMQLVFINSGNWLLTIPKKGCEEEWEHYRERAAALDQLLGSNLPED